MTIKDYLIGNFKNKNTKQQSKEEMLKILKTCHIAFGGSLKDFK